MHNYDKSVITIHYVPKNEPMLIKCITLTNTNRSLEHTASNIVKTTKNYLHKYCISCLITAATLPCKTKCWLYYYSIIIIIIIITAWSLIVALLCGLCQRNNTNSEHFILQGVK